MRMTSKTVRNTVVSSLEDMYNTLEAFGTFALGSPNESNTLAQEWVDAGFTCQEANTWVEVGVFSADRAVILHNAGIDANEVYETDASVKGFSTNGIGYDFANCDVTLEQVLSAM